ncbi:MAG: MFS transporter [Candidatus Rokubacteria bacterium]|nr:MFS transporter [Candidatus Rokubacteria bacterium]
MIRTLAFILSGPFARATLTNFFFFFSLNGFVLLPIYVKTLGGDEADIGMIQAMYSAAGIICQPLIGQWVDRLGRRFFMVLGAACLAISGAVFTLSASVVLFAILRALHGVAFSAFFVANYVHIVDLAPVERRGWALGIFGLSGLLATALAPLAGEYAIRHWGFPALFAALTILAGGALAAVLTARDIRPPSLEGEPGLTSVRQVLRALLRTHMAVAFFFGLGTGVIFTFLPTFGELLGVRGVGLFYTAYAVAAMLVRVMGGELIDTLGRRAVIIPSMFVQAAATMVLALLAFVAGANPSFPVLPFLFLAGFLAGAAHGFLYPALSALLMDVTAETRRASVVGIFSSVFLLGNALGAIAFGFVAHGFGYRVLWSSLAGVLLAGFLYSFRLRVGLRRGSRRRRAYPRRDDADETGAVGGDAWPRG